MTMQSARRQVEVKTGARLHFGLLAGQQREFGGAGLMIDSPGFHVSITSADEDSIKASPCYTERIQQLIQSHRESCHPSMPTILVELNQEIPPHIGLGSGTQLGLAVAKALALFSGESEVSTTTLAQRAKRGARSAVGIHGFEFGGFLVDGGKIDGDDIGKLVGRYEVPIEWRFVLVTPSSHVGLSGKQEKEVFARLPPMLQSTTDQLDSIMTTQMIPAILDADCNNFGDAVYEFGKLIGGYFSPIQSGVFADDLMANLVVDLRKRGINGVGQTSWGPTIFAVCSNQDEATSLIADLKSENCYSDCTIRIASAMNRGAL